MLLLGGVEPNPGPGTQPGSVLKLGVLNAHSAIHEAPLLHDVTADHRLDSLVVTETWMLAGQPAAITDDIAPAGYRVYPDFRQASEPGGGIAVICRNEFQAARVNLSSIRTSWQCLVVKVTGRSSRINIAAVYRPPTSSSYGIPVAQFCAEFDDLLAELLALPGQLLICGDFNSQATERH